MFPGEILTIRKDGVLFQEDTLLVENGVVLNLTCSIQNPTSVVNLEWIVDGVIRHLGHSKDPENMATLVIDSNDIRESITCVMDDIYPKGSNRSLLVVKRNTTATSGEIIKELSLWVK